MTAKLAAPWPASRPNSCTTRIPERCSCRKPLIRATRIRMSRKASRTLRRNTAATSSMTGMTAKATRARRQSTTSIIVMMAMQREHVAEHGHHSGREQLVECLDVGGDPGHQPADRIAVEVGDAETLQVGEQLEPEIGHHSLTDPGGEQRLTVVERELEQQRAGRMPRRGCPAGRDPGEGPRHRAPAG